MPTLLQINPVIRTSTSTGRIMREIGDVAMAQGWRSILAYSAGRDGLDLECSSEKLPVGTRLDVAVHGLATRLLDRHGLQSRSVTRRFINQLKDIKPDIIHIHNIHGYFLNYPLLFDYLKESGIPVIWTVHDCWLYTGHCYYYSFAGCNRWQNGCGSCPQHNQFPKSWIRDRSARNFLSKQKAFTSLPFEQLTIVPVSQWIRKEMSQSFLKDCQFQVIHNGIDLSIFKPSDTSNVRNIYGLGDKKIILGIASIWLKEKGLDDFIAMSQMLNNDEKIVLVGKMTDKQKKLLPQNILHIPRTDNVVGLAALYSAATAFVNPTWQDNYPTVNLEAQACGTPVVTYRTGGSPESLTPTTGRVVEQGDVKGLLDAVREFAAADRKTLKEACRKHAYTHFDKNERYAEYLALYNNLL